MYRDNTTAFGTASGGYGKTGAQSPSMLQPNQPNINTVIRVGKEQIWYFYGDTTIWDIDKNSNTRQPKVRTTHYRE